MSRLDRIQPERWVDRLDGHEKQRLALAIGLVGVTLLGGLAHLDLVTDEQAVGLAIPVGLAALWLWDRAREELQARCENCQAELEDDMNYCPRCGCLVVDQPPVFRGEPTDRGAR